MISGQAGKKRLSNKRSSLMRRHARDESVGAFPVSDLTSDRFPEKPLYGLLARSLDATRLRPSVAARSPGSVRLGFDCLHVGVGKAEMVADLMDQHVGNDGAERVLMLTPIVEDWPAVEPDHVGHLHRRAF